jgi:hypothetical protein
MKTSAGDFNDGAFPSFVCLRRKTTEARTGVRGDKPVALAQNVDNSMPSVITGNYANLLVLRRLAPRISRGGRG